MTKAQSGHRTGAGLQALLALSERFGCTLELQATYGWIFRNLEETREVVDAFVKRYYAQWRLEKLRFRTPPEARRAALCQEAA